MENGKTHNNLTKINVKIVIPLKLLSDFWRNLNIPSINSGIIDIRCVLIDKLTRYANYNVNPRVSEINNPENRIFQITDTKLYVPAVSLSKENDINILELLKSGFKRTIKWNKYRSQMTIQPQNNNSNYLFDSTFTNFNRLFVLSFSRNNNTDNRDPFSDYYVRNVEIKDFNVLIDGKSFFDLPVKNEEESYKKIIEMNNNNINSYKYTTGNLLDFAYFKKNYKLIAIDLSKQTNLKDPQKINFTGKPLKNTKPTMFFIIEKSQETTFNFSQNSTTVI